MNITTAQGENILMREAAGVAYIVLALRPDNKIMSAVVECRIEGDSKMLEKSGIEESHMETKRSF